MSWLGGGGGGEETGIALFLKEGIESLKLQKVRGLNSTIESLWMEIPSLKYIV